MEPPDVKRKQCALFFPLPQQRQKQGFARVFAAGRSARRVRPHGWARKTQYRGLCNGSARVVWKTAALRVWRNAWE